MKYSFRNDYSELAHPKILELMIKSANEQNIGYGLDVHSDRAKSLIEKHIKRKVDIHFLAGGTSANKILISHVLKSYEAVISVESGHINVHEAGAVEANGHKILYYPGKNGKLLPEEIVDSVLIHCDEHMVIPKLVYISNATELGTVYTKEEIIAIKEVCEKYNLYLFIDGARIAQALVSHENDLDLNDFAELSDAFYIGGTKNGAMIGEALILVNPLFKKNFRNSIKQNGGMLAKGYLVAMQYECLFTDNLFYVLAKHAVDAGMLLRDELQKEGVEFLIDSNINMQFIIINNEWLKKLNKLYDFEVWKRIDNNKSAIRLVTSWATDIKAIHEFMKDFREIKNA
ncbi:MAG TPA: aminotransferase class I/II-fold pyridoxal phosphate-dependent enzyme [Acholeplasmataceae bacterium]|nr:aminotransferase class I/II-fold pyridoxal phosphate-dependent enzyme [Acholeplasmataceae bacterium]